MMRNQARMRVAEVACVLHLTLSLVLARRQFKYSIHDILDIVHESSR